VAGSPGLDFIVFAIPGAGVRTIALGSEPARALSVTIPIAAGGTPTFAVFVQAFDEIPFDPANRRACVRLKDDQGNTRGETSVAVTTQ
jgi:hypothetical protein